MQAHSLLNPTFPMPTLILHPLVYRAGICLLQRYFEFQQDDLATSYCTADDIFMGTNTCIDMEFKKKTVLYTEI